MPSELQPARRVPRMRIARPALLLASVFGLSAYSGCNSEPPSPRDPDASKPETVRRSDASNLPPIKGSRANSSAEPSPFRFAEIAEQAGIDFVHVSGMTDERHFPTANGSGVALFDYDGDGKLDIYLASNCHLPLGSRPEGQNRLYRNLGGMKFEDVTEQSGLGFHGFVHGIIAADFDNDGDTDVFLATYHQNTLFLNNGDGTFTDVGELAGVAPARFRGRISDGGESTGPIVVDAVEGLKWKVEGGEPTNDLTLKVKPGQRLIFRQADPTAPRGLELLANPETYRRLGESESQKPNAKFVEIGAEGAPSGLYQGKPPLEPGAGPVVIAELEVVRPIGPRNVGFECAMHRTAWSSGGAPIDFDGDGLLDLYVSNYGFWTVEDHGDLYCGHVEKGVRQYCSPKEVTTVRHILYRNEGVVDGIPRFTDVTAEAGVNRADGHGFGVVAADLNGDGLIDLHVANDQNPAFLYLNNGDGTFTDATELSNAGYDERGYTQSGMGVDATDIDGDGLPELFRTNFAGEYNTLFQNLGRGNFHDQTAAYGLAADAMAHVGWGCALADFDNDGWPDAFVANGHVDNNHAEAGNPNVPYEQPPLLHRNVALTDAPDSPRRFRLATRGVGPYFDSLHVARGVAFGDLDDDGDLDIVINHKDGRPALLRNDNPSDGNRWIRLNLQGVTSNRDAIGTKVQVIVGNRTIYRQLKGGYSLESTNDPRLLIGLGPVDRIETILIRWPSGRETVLKDVEPNQTLELEEPAE